MVVIVVVVVLVVYQVIVVVVVYQGDGFRVSLVRRLRAARK